MRALASMIDKRTDRVRLYSYSDGGSDGVVTPTHTFVEEVWASFRPQSGQEGTTGEAAQHQRSAVFGFHERTSVNDDMVLTINGEPYKVTSIADPRTFVDGMLREVMGQSVDKAQYNLVEP
jgi:SPP1 family predicted phage head-tail adaptor